MENSPDHSDPHLERLKEIDRLADQFERAFRNGENPRIEWFVEQNSQLGSDLVLGLIELEIDLRRRAGKQSDVAEYAHRFQQHRTKIESLFSSGDSTRSLDESLDTKIHAGTSIGPYKILQRIGQGGMGEVYMAEQLLPVKRRVALKVIRSESPTKEIIGRFEAERQALAMMDHPNIAKVLDAGTTEDGRPYFAMELVKGVPISEYCDKNKLTPSERLQLFVQACRAIHHAHQKGIIHRDIKPSNVLVTLYDGKPIAKVIDFGLAKAVFDQTQLTNRSLFTEFGRVVGTLEYMSPEQAEMNALDVDIRTDVYSLGVILFELLTGSTPLGHKRLKREALDRILYLIREEDVQRPSTRLSESGDALTGISEQRKTDPWKLALMLKRDLDWIAIKALEKDRTRRYDSASAMAEDVERFLRDEPIVARPPTFNYVFRKAYRKHKSKFLAAVAFVTLLVCGLVGLGALWIRAEKHKAIAVRAREQADLATALSNTERQKAVRAQQEAQQATERAILANAELSQQRDEVQRALIQVESERTRAEQSLATAKQAVETFYTKVADNHLLNLPDLQTLRGELLSEAGDYYQDFLKLSRDDPALQLELAAAHFRIAQIRFDGDVISTLKALLEFQRGHAILKQSLTEPPDGVAWGSIAQGMYRGRMRFKPGEAAKIPTWVAQRLLPEVRDACATWEELVTRLPEAAGVKNDLAGLYNILALVENSSIVQNNWLDSLLDHSGALDNRIAAFDNASVDSYHKAIAIWQELRKDAPDNRDYQSEIGMAYSNLAKVYTERFDRKREPADLQRAIETQIKSVELHRDIVAADAGEPQPSFVIDLAAAYRELAYLHLRRDEFEVVSELCHLAEESLKKYPPTAQQLELDAIQAIKQELQTKQTKAKN